MSNRLRYMQLDIDDLTNDPNWIVMDPAQRGMYMALLIHQWRQGYLPENDHDLRKIAGASARMWKQKGAQVRSLFVSTGGSRLINKRCANDRDRICNRIEKQSVEGRKGARKRWGTNSQPNGSPNGYPIANEKVKVNENVNTTSEVECSHEKNLSNNHPLNSELPSGGGLIFGRDLKIKELERRYQPAGGPEDFDGDESVDFFAILDDIAPRKNQRLRLGTLLALVDSSYAAIALTLQQWAELEDRPRQPNRYFLAMVRNNEIKAARIMDEFDRRQEARNGDNRRSEKAKETTQDTADRGQESGFNTIGDVLRDMPEV